MKIPFLKNLGYNRETVILITWKIVECAMDTFYKKIFDTRDISFVFKCPQKIIKKIDVDSEKSTNLFDTKKKIKY